MYKIETPEMAIVAKQAFVTKQQPLLDKVCSDYGRNPNGLCIKVFYGNPLKENETLEDALWGDNHDITNHNKVRKNTKLIIGSKIQNILWKHNLSARVYAIFEAEFKGNRVACQLTDYLDGSYASNIKEVEKLHNHDIAALAKTYCFSDVKDILSCKDIIGGKIIDVQQYTFDKGIEDKIKEIYFNQGKYGKIYYQAVPELGLSGGPRKSLDRVDYMKLDSIDFKGKIVWDIGCAGGFFCRYALSRGAKIVYGFDEPDPVFSAFMVSNYLGYFNIDYIATDLSKGIPSDIPKADIAYFLSMNLHIGIPERLKEVPFIIFEDNSYDGRDKEVLDKPWTDWFNDIEFVGRAKDHGNKSIYKLNK